MWGESTRRRTGRYGETWGESTRRRTGRYGETWGDSTRRRTGSRSLTHRDARVSHEFLPWVDRRLLSSSFLRESESRSEARRLEGASRHPPRRSSVLGDGAAARRAQVRAAHGDAPAARPGRALHPHVCRPELPNPRAGVHRGRTRGVRTSSFISNELPHPRAARRGARLGRVGGHVGAVAAGRSVALDAEYLPIPPRISPHLEPQKRSTSPYLPASPRISRPRSGIFHPALERTRTHAGALDTLPGAALPS